MARMEASTHLLAFSAMLARDPLAGRLNTRDLQVLGVIIAARRPIAVADVARQIGVTGAPVSHAAEHLVRHGLIIRARDTGEDRRLALLSATTEGIALDTRVRNLFRAAKPKATAVA